MSEKNLLELKIKRLDDIIDAEVVELVRQELFLKNEEIGFGEVEDAIKEKLETERQARVTRFKNDIVNIEKNIEVAELLKLDYLAQQKKLK